MQLWMRRKYALTYASFALLTVPAAVGAQVLQECTGTCRIDVERVAVLGNLNGGEGFVGRPQALTRLNDGRFILADRYDQDRLKIYSASGEYERSVGRRGKGPGEYEIVQYVSGIGGDSIEVYDLRQSRITVLNPSFGVVRSIKIGIPAWEMHRFSDGSRVISASYIGSQSAGLPLHRISEAGSVEGSFGANPPIADLRNDQLIYRQLAGKRGSDDFWSAHLTQFRLERWSRSGELLQVLTRNVAWFKPHSVYGFVNAATPPNPGVMAIHMDDNGLLWTLTTIPDTKWRDGVGTRKDPYGRTGPGVTSTRSYYDSLVEVIDPVRRRVLGAARLDEQAVAFTDDGLLFGFDDESFAEPVVLVWRVVLPGGSR